MIPPFSTYGLRAALARPEVKPLAFAVVGTIAASAVMAVYTLNHRELGLTRKRTFLWREIQQDQCTKLHHVEAFSPNALKNHRSEATKVSF